MMRWMVLTFLLLAAGHVWASEGLVKLASPYSVSETMDRLESVLMRKGMTVFKRIDHGAGATDAGLVLRPTELLVFGNPKVGTPLMQCQQRVAIDLPQKALAWQDENGQVWLGYNDPDYLADRHRLEDCKATLDKVRGALEAFAGLAVE